MKAVTRTVYEDLDGNLHDTELACLQADRIIEQERKSTFFFRVHHGFDCTEGRGYYHCTIVKIKTPGRTPNKDIARAFVEDYFHEKCRGKVTWIMGVEPVIGFRVTDCEVDNWNNAPEKPTRMGGGIMQTSRAILVVDENRKVHLDE